MKALFALVAIAIPAAAIAQTSAVSLEAKTFVARKVTLPDGKTDNKLFAPDRVLPGEAVVFMLEYKNQGAKPATGFVINNPVPANIEYTGSEQPWAIVSVDNGKTFGALATLKIKAADGKLRPATTADVTNVRWAFAKPINAGGAGRVSFYGVVK
jgi:uncharacterized repeat protein (TIGR01451 family)